MIAMPYYTLFEALGPLVETAGYVFVVVLFLLGALQPAFFFAFLALAVLFGILLSICALNLDDLLIKKHRSAGDLAKMTLGSVIEFLGYRQLMTAIGCWPSLRSSCAEGAGAGCTANRSRRTDPTPDRTAACARRRTSSP